MNPLLPLFVLLIGGAYCGIGALLRRRFRITTGPNKFGSFLRGFGFVLVLAAGVLALVA